MTSPTYTNVLTNGAGAGAITFASNNTSVATVNTTTGQVSFLQPGTVIITATKAATAIHLQAVRTYTITAERVASHVVLSQTNYNVVATDTFIPPTVSGAGTGALSYLSSNQSVAIVNPTTGAVTLVGQGTATITVTKAQTNTHSSAVDTYTINVTRANASVSFSQTGPFSVIPTNPFVAPTASRTGDGTLTYSSSNPSVATVNSTTGAVTIIGQGTVRITASSSQTAKYNAASDHYDITVMRNTSQIALVGEPTALYVGGTFALANITVTNEGDQPTTFTSSNPSVVTVNTTTGVLEAVGAGTATITVTRPQTAKYEQSTETFTITVGLNPNPVSFAEGTKTIDFGQTTINQLINSFSGAGYTFNSSNPLVATVDSLGNITALTPGTTTITFTQQASATYAAKTISYTLTVQLPLAPFDLDQAANHPLSEAYFLIVYDDSASLDTSSFSYSVESGDAIVSSTGVVTFGPNALNFGLVIVKVTRAATVNYRETEKLIVITPY